ncbi:MAG: ECF-type sigma factor [Acidobacteriota bacterium]|nr:ECF-type sigma factor [Acidobacteriota bacterium]
MLGNTLRYPLQSPRSIRLSRLLQSTSYGSFATRFICALIFLTRQSDLPDTTRAHKSFRAEVDKREARVIEMRYFGGLSVEETAAVLEVSENTVIRDWALAKAWLRREMDGERGRDER